MNLLPPPTQFLFLLAVGLSLWVGCGPASEPEEAPPSEPVSAIEPPPQARPDHHTSRDSLDWDGTYTGGALTLTLTRDGSFVLMVAGSEPVVGDFEWSGDGSSITLMGVGENPARFLVGEGVLVRVNEEGQPLEGGDGTEGRLIKQAAQPSADPETTAKAPVLEGRRWVLVELRGRPVERTGENPQEIFIEFDATEGRVSGFGGCNRFSGPYEVKDGLRLKFGNLMSTLMVCPDQELEQEWFAVLAETDNYTLSEDGSTLSMNKARMAPLARLKAQ